MGEAWFQWAQGPSGSWLDAGCLWQLPDQQQRPSVDDDDEDDGDGTYGDHNNGDDNDGDCNDAGGGSHDHDGGGGDYGVVRYISLNLNMVDKKEMRENYVLMKGSEEITQKRHHPVR